MRTAALDDVNNGDYKPFAFDQAIMTSDIEFSEDMFLITTETR